MKISPKHFPPISMFCQKKTVFDFSIINPNNEERKSLQKTINTLIAENRKNIFTVSTSIHKLLEPNKERLTDAYWDNPGKESFSGAYINSQHGIPFVILFKFEPGKGINPNSGGEEDCLDYTFAYVEGNNIVTAIGGIRLFYNGNMNYSLNTDVATIKGKSNDKVMENCQKSMFYLLAVSIFLKYADVEVVNIYGNQRKALPDKSDVIENKSGVPVKFIDSHWIREIIRTEGFKVRGHFRLQPTKNEDGEWTRKLIYINEFEKHGYHRRALKTLEDNTNFLQ